jgi:hypothetical protein
VGAKNNLIILLASGPNICSQTGQKNRTTSTSGSPNLAAHSHHQCWTSLTSLPLSNHRYSPRMQILLTFPPLTEAARIRPCSSTQLAARVGQSGPLTVSRVSDPSVPNLGSARCLARAWRCSSRRQRACPTPSGQDTSYVNNGLRRSSRARDSASW